MHSATTTITYHDTLPLPTIKHCPRNGVGTPINKKALPRSFHRGRAAVLQSSGLVQGSRHLFDQSQSLLNVFGPTQFFHRGGDDRWSFDDLDYCLEDGESSRTAQARGTSALRAALASGARCVLVTHGNMLALILRSIDPTVGFDVWSRLSNPDVFVLDFNDEGPRGFS